MEKVIKKKALILHVNIWLQSWYQQQGFGFCDCGMLLRHHCMLRRDEIHLTKRGKGMFGSRMAAPVR